MINYFWREEMHPRLLYFTCTWLTLAWTGYSWAKTISCSTDCSNYLKKKAFRAATIQKYTVCFPLNLVRMHTSSHWTRQTERLLVRDTSQASVEAPRMGQQGMETIWCFLYCDLKRTTCSYTTQIRLIFQ